MEKRLSCFGVGPMILASVIACAAFAGTLLYLNPAACAVPAFRAPAIVAFGLVLIGLGLTMWLLGAAGAMKAYNADRLVTTGVFRLVRHPMYAGWIVLVLPGIALLTAAWPFLLMPLVGYAAFKAYIHVEDEYLEERFGRSFTAYREDVNAILPIPRHHHHIEAHR